jgi:hypothetical protein
VKINKWDIVKVRDTNQEALVLQIFKSGLYLLQLHDGSEIRLSKKQLDLVKAYDPEAGPFPLFRLEKAS